MHRTQKGILAAVLGAGVLGLSVTGGAFAARGHHTSSLPQGQGRLAGYIASVEGVTPTVLKQDLKAGKNLLQIDQTDGNKKYTSADALATALLAPLKTRLDAAVTGNHLTGAQETAIYSRLHTRLATLVVTAHPFQQLRKEMGKGTRAARTSLLQTMATTCGTTPTALQAAFKTGGKSPLAICQVTKPGITQQELVSALMKSFQTRLAAIAKTSGMTAQQQSQILSRIQSRLTTWVVSPLPAGGLRHL